MAELADASGQLIAGQLSSGQLSSGQLSSGQLSSGQLSSGQLSSGQLSSGQEQTSRRAEFDRLVERYHKQAYNIAYRMTGNHADAEDLAQEAFVRAFRFFGNYRRDWPFDNWLYKIMSNLFVDDLRRRPKAHLQSLDQPLDVGSGDVYLEIPDIGKNPERMVMSHELDEHIQRALNSLPNDFRMTVILADIEGLSYEEISTAMNCSLGTVRSRLHRGRKLLRSKIAAFEQDGLLRDGLLPAGRL